MSKKSDDSIERFFKKAVAQQDLSHRASDWKQMEKMLDEQDFAAAALAVRARKKVATYAIVAMLFISGTYLAVVRPWGPVSKDKIVKQAEQNSKSSQAAAGKLGPLSGDKEIPSADLPSLPSEITSSDRSDHSKSTSNNSGTSQNVVAKDTSNPLAELQRTMKRHEPGVVTSDSHQVTTSEASPVRKTSNESNDILITHNELQSAVRGSNGEVNGSNENENDVSVKTDNPSLPSTEATSSEEGILANRSGDHISGNEVKDQENKIETDSVLTENTQIEKNVEQKSDESERSEDQPAKIPSRWSVALTVAPDFSSTSVGRYSAPGTAFGLFASFRPLPRWQLSTGVIKSAKQYEGYGNEYEPPSGYWDRRTNGIVPDEVEGSCGIIEWPIILRYDFIVKTNARFYVTSGISSYLMRTESYKYTFAQENPGAAQGWEASRPTSYSFSIGHLSAGYERSLTNRFAVAIEPYFKIPFKAIGWTNINLHTTGAYLTVRYTFQKRSVVPTIQK